MNNELIMHQKLACRVPLIGNLALRGFLGLLAYFLAFATSLRVFDSAEDVHFYLILSVLFAWLPSVILTAKYEHKYPQRYHSYLASSHGKSFLILIVLHAAAYFLWAPASLTLEALVLGLVIFSIVDFLLSLPSKSRAPSNTDYKSFYGDREAKESNKSAQSLTLVEIDKQAVLNQLEHILSDEEFAFVEAGMLDSQGQFATILINEEESKGIVPPIEESHSKDFLLEKVLMNEVLSLDRSVARSVEMLRPGGYLLVHFQPLELQIQKMKMSHTKIGFKVRYATHFFFKRIFPKIPVIDKIYAAAPMSWIDKAVFSTFKRNRAVSKAEMLGRLIAQGMDIVSTQDIGGSLFVLSRKVKQPTSNANPSYYAVVSLEKVGLDGNILRLHKVRSMFPYSEFLQQYMYDTEGLTKTGKFKNDYRLTEYGPFIRKYWLDEIPQIFDWLRGDIKLVGMRATSPQYLSLYPEEVYNLYAQIKPGLVPPIFDESTDGFDKIVEIELSYLRGYMENPVQTDLSLLWKTFSDIFLRGVRSK